MNGISQDLRYAVRALRSNRGFAIAAILTLAIAIAANTSVFSVLNAVLLNPRSLRRVHDAGRVVVLYEKNPTLTSFIADRLPPRAKTVAVWERDAHSLEDFVVTRDSTVTIQNTAKTKTEEGDRLLATASLFSMLGIRPAIGRPITAADANKQVALITDSLYRRMFNSDPRILQREVIVNGHAMHIIGVLPANFELPSSWLNQNKPAVFGMLDTNLATDKDQSFNLGVLARLRPGITLPQAQAELNTIAVRLRKDNASDYEGFYVNVHSILDEMVDPDMQRGLVILQIAVVFVLLIACANVGNLLLTRAVARDKEVAVRIAIGAGRWRIVSQVLSESCLIALVAGAIGIGATFAILRVLSSMVPDVQGFHELRVDVPVMLFTVAASLLCGVVFAIPAIWRSWGLEVNETLNRSSRTVSGSSNRLRTGLAVAQVALSLVLLVGAGLLLRSLVVLLNVDLGFERTHLTSVRLILPNGRYNDDRAIAFNRTLLASVAHIPGVESAALSTGIPMRGFSVSSFDIPGWHGKPGELPNADWAFTTADYFKSMGIQVVRGRTYSPDEVSTRAPVAVINRKLGELYWKGQNPVGKTVKWGNPARPVTVIGVVGNEHQAGPEAEQSPEIYQPGFDYNQVYAIARTAGNPANYATELTAVVKRLDPELRPEVQSANESLSDWLAPRRFNLTVISCFAAVAIVLAAIGLYSLLAYSITLRQREIGIRLAIGADPGAVTKMILRHATLIACAGITIGLGCAFALTQFMQSLVFGVSTADPTTFIAVSLLLALLCIVAAYAPARRAARIDPVIALRQE